MSAAEKLVDDPGAKAGRHLVEIREGDEPPTADDYGVTVWDFWAHMPTNQFIFAPTRELWVPASVNARLHVMGPDDKPMKATTFITQQQSVEQMVWSPGDPMIIEDRLISGGGWFKRDGCAAFNLYLPPTVNLGDAAEGDRWAKHVHLLYPGEAEHIIAWLAHRVQRPGEKINHGLVFGGAPGIGKDSILVPAQHAVGPWNFREVSPQQLLGRFNGFVKSVILRVSEARDLGDIDRYGFYEATKTFLAAPPDTLTCDEKNLREHAVFNVCGVVITSNHKDGLYLPADDRRHFVAWSDLTSADFDPAYWTNLYRWFANGGNEHVAAYLHEYDLSAFDPKAPPPKTAAFWDIVDAGRAPEEAEIADVIDSLGHPQAVTTEQLAERATGSFGEWLRDRKSRRQVPHRLESAGYTPVRNDAAKDGLWKIGRRRQVVYAQRSLAVRDRIAAAAAIAEGSAR